MSSTHPRPVAYFRKSNEDDGNSIDQQREWARKACARAGFNLVEEFSDRSRSRVTTRREPGLLRCSPTVGPPPVSANISVVVVWHEDRFSRSDSLETAATLHEFRKVGVSRMLTSQKMIEFNRLEDRLLFGVSQEAGSHKYVVDLASSTMRGRTAAATAGRWAGGSFPYGYRPEREEVPGESRLRTIRLILGPDAEVTTVKLIFDLYANTKAGVRAVCRELAQRGILSPAGGAVWPSSTVRAIIRNPVYLGRLAWNKTANGKFIGVVDGRAMSRPSVAGRGRGNSREQWIEQEDCHEAIVDLTTFERCQAKMAGRAAGERPGAAGSSCPA